MRDLRKALGITQQGLAQKLGVAVGTVYRWEHDRGIPTRLAREKLERLARQAREQREEVKP